MVPTATLYITILLFMFAGILIGHWLSRREDKNHESDRVGLAKENLELKDALQQGHATLTELEAKYSRQNGQLNVLQQLCDDWSTSREESERDRTKLEVLLSEHQKRCEDLTQQLGYQTQLRIELEDRAHEIQHQHVEKTGTIETEWLKKHSQTESLLSQRENDLKHAHKENSRTAEQLHSAEAKIAELTSELASQKTLHDTVTRNASGLEKEYTTLETSVKHSNMRLKDAEAKCAKAISAKNLAEESLEAFRTQLEQQRNENTELRSTLAGLESVKQQFGTVQTSLANSDERLRVVATERDRAIGAEKAAHEHIIGLQKQVENQESTIKLIRRNHDDALDKLRIELEKRAESEKNFERFQVQSQQELKQQSSQLESIERERDEVIAQLSDRSDELVAQLEEVESHRKESEISLQRNQEEFDAFKQQYTDLESRLATESEQRAQFEADWNQSCDDLIANQAECERLQNQLLSENQERESTRDEHEALRSMLEAENKQRSELEANKIQLEGSLKVLKTRCDQMMNELSELQMIRDQHSQVSDKWKQYRIRLEQTISQRDSALDQLAARKIEIEQMETQLGTTNETVRQLRDRLAATNEAKTTDSQILPLTHARTTVDHEYGGNTRLDEIRGIVFTERPQVVDNLKLISGVAEVLEGKLNAYGVYTFRQIMEWNATNIEEFKQLLPSFKDRIVREDWIGQASHLYEHFHGSRQQAA